MVYTVQACHFDIQDIPLLHWYSSSPPHLTDLVQFYQPARCLRSFDSHQLVIPRHNLSLGSRDFSISAPHIWNSLPINICKIQSVSTFRRHLKTHFFQPFLPLASRHPVRPDSFKISALYIFYLLTYINHFKFDIIKIYKLGPIIWKSRHLHNTIQYNSEICKAPLYNLSRSANRTK